MLQRSTRIALVGALLALPAAATVVIAQSLEEMAATSPLVLRATIGQVQTAWNEGHTTIETFAEVSVREALKGSVAPGAILMVRSPGGIVGKMGAYVAGAPQFKQGEEVVLLLEPAADRPDVWLVSGLAAGKINLEKNSFGELRAVRDLRGIAFYERTAKAPKYHEVTKPEDLGTPEQVIARLRAAVTKAVPPLNPAVKTQKGATR